MKRPLLLPISSSIRLAEFHARYPHITLDIQEMVPQEKMEACCWKMMDIGMPLPGTAPEIISPRCLQEVLAQLSRTSCWPQKNPFDQLAAEEFIR